MIRTLAIWVLIQSLAIGAIWLAIQGMRFPMIWEPGVMPTLGLPALIGWVDRQFANDHLLHENLGTSSLWFWGASLAISFTMDGLAIAIGGRS